MEIPTTVGNIALLSFQATQLWGWYDAMARSGENSRDDSVFWYCNGVRSCVCGLVRYAQWRTTFGRTWYGGDEASAV